MPHFIVLELALFCTCCRRYWLRDVDRDRRDLRWPHDQTNAVCCGYTPPVRTFRSDNNAGLCAEAAQAIADAETGHQRAYGEDEWTARAVDAFRGIFGPDVAVFFVASGTAANALAIAALTEPWQQIVCHNHSHVVCDESTVQERLTHCRVVAAGSGGPMLLPDDIRRAAGGTRGDVHQPQPGVVTVSNSSELGAVYTPEQMRTIAETAHELGYRVHLDGARFANAVASLGCSPQDLAGAAGVDALTFGGTKNGLASGEAVVFFRQAGSPGWFARAIDAFPFHRKSTGHLLSKHRFVTAPFEAVLRSGAWLSHAGKANRMAARLDAGLRALGYDLPYTSEANAVFVRLSPAADAYLRGRGHGYYPFGDGGLVRLMSSFDTTDADVDTFLADAAAALER